MKMLLTVELPDAQARSLRLYLERYLTTYVPEATWDVKIAPKDQGEMFPPRT